LVGLVFEEILAPVENTTGFHHRRLRGREAVNGHEGGGLSGAVGTDESDDLSLLDMEAHAVQGLYTPVGRSEILNL
jgi:hypothetical protein